MTHAPLNTPDRANVPGVGTDAGEAPVHSVTDIISDELRACIDANGGLLGAANVAERLGVSRERVRQLAQHPAFPRPITRARINGGEQPLWLGADIDQWARRRRERLKKRAQRGTRSDRMRGPRA